MNLNTMDEDEQSFEIVTCKKEKKKPGRNVTKTVDLVPNNRLKKSAASSIAKEEECFSKNVEVIVSKQDNYNGVEQDEQLENKIAKEMKQIRITQMNRNNSACKVPYDAYDFTIQFRNYESCGNQVKFFVRHERLIRFDADEITL
jgi:hypothetical protein